MDKNENINELLETLDSIEAIIESCNTQSILWTGDLNFDLTRDSLCCTEIKQWLERHGIVSVWSQCTVDYTHRNIDSSSPAVLDHCLATQDILSLITSATVHHSGDNLSRHDPIIVELTLKVTGSDNKSSKYKSPSWQSANPHSIEQYTSQLHSRMSDISMSPSTLCSNPACEVSSHHSDIDSSTLDLLQSVIEVSYATIPVPAPPKSKRRRHNLPGWKSDVEPLRKDSIYWHIQWCNEGKPLNGWLYTTMCDKRRMYHRAVKVCMTSNKQQQAEKLLAASLVGDRQFMAELKKARSGHNCCASTESVDSASTETDIAAKFRDIYSTLYNETDGIQLTANLSAQIRDSINREPGRHLPVVEQLTTDVLMKAASMMKTKKLDLSGGFSSDALLHAPKSFFTKLAVLFRAWITHGYVPLFLLASSLLPHVKPGKDPLKSSSYRAIAGTSLLLRLLEKVILLIWGPCVPTDSLQFGFKKGTGTSQCSWLLMETLEYFKKRKSRVWVVTLDCTKAFDKCQWGILFGDVSKYLPPLITRILLFTYTNQSAWVSWGNTCSELITITNGTGQGKVGSPALWGIYILPLILKLRQQGVGCHIGEVFLGALLYADDIILLSPSRHAASMMLRTCEEWSNKSGISFSTDPTPAKSKSKIMVTGTNSNNLGRLSPLPLYGVNLPFVERIDHLGHVFVSSSDMTADCNRSWASFCNRSVELRDALRDIHPREVSRSHNVYCNDWYGSVLWRLDAPYMARIYNSHKSTTKLIYDLPHNCHRFITEHLASDMRNPRLDIWWRTTKFTRNLLKSPSKEMSSWPPCLSMTRGAPLGQTSPSWRMN